MVARSQFVRGSAIIALLAVSGVVLRGSGAEDELKCATLLAFVQNAHWAEPVAASDPLTVGVVGRAVFVKGLIASAEGRAVNGRPVRVIGISGTPDPRCCQVLYFATDKLAEIKPVLQSFSSSHVLTVGECDGFLEQGGAVNLFLTDGHMSFEVSLGALSRAGVEISAKLLRFGQIRDLTKGRPK